MDAESHFRKFFHAGAGDLFNLSGITETDGVAKGHLRDAHVGYRLHISENGIRRKESFEGTPENCGQSGTNGCIRMG